MFSARALMASVNLPRHECWALLEGASGRPREYWITHDQEHLTAPTVHLFQRWAAERSKGRPLAYLLGFREFYGRRFWVNRHTLIPRSDTELLIDTALPLLKAQGRPVTVCDLGTGSGCIAITLALECPDITVLATDISSRALQTAANNAAWLGAADRVCFRQGSWWEAVATGTAQFFGIVSNPPYIARADAHLGQGDLPFEPEGALTDHSVDGLEAIGCIVQAAPPHLQAGGFLLIEHGFDQQDAVLELFARAGLENLHGLRDLNGTPRAVLGSKMIDN
jgi:release factor glutamine methyltransferase